MDEKRNYGNESVAYDRRNRQEISIKFGKGLAQTFKDREGHEYVRIHIPNRDLKERMPWSSFVLPAKAVHENKFGKGLWAKLPADGSTTITKPVLIRDGAGKIIRNDEKREIPNTELKSLVEAYRNKPPKEEERKSARETIDEMLKANGGRLFPAKPFIDGKADERKLANPPGRTSLQHRAKAEHHPL